MPIMLHVLLLLQNVGEVLHRLRGGFEQSERLRRLVVLPDRLDGISISSSILLSKFCGFLLDGETSKGSLSESDIIK